MANEKSKETQGQEQNVEPTLQDVMAAINQLNGRLDQQEQFINEQFGGNEPSLQDLVEASDQDLASLGLTRAEVDAAVQEVMAGMEGEGAKAGEAGQNGQGEGELAAAGAAATGAADFSPAGASAAPVAGQLAALQREVIQLKNKQQITELRAKQNAEEVELASIEEKVMVLAKQRDDAIKLAEKVTAENDALRVANRTGTRPVRAGVDNGLRLFSANDEGQLHEFQVRVQALKTSGKTEGEAILLAQKENPSMHADWLQSLKPKSAAAA